MVSMLDKARRGWSHIGRCRSTSRVRGEATTPYRCAAMGRVELKLSGLSGKALTRDATKKASVRCPCSRLAELHDASRTRNRGKLPAL